VPGKKLINVEVTGWDSLITFIDTIPLQMTRATSEAMHRWGRLVMLTSRQKYVPVLTGRLIQSGRVSGPHVEGDGHIRMELDYLAPYALDQHENLNYKHPRGGQAKYLEQAVVDRKQELLQIVKDELQNSIRK
jgi:hypothetical protein